MTKVVVVAPHPDDETLGCGGTLLRHKEESDEVHWIICTGISEQSGYSASSVELSANEITQVAQLYGFDSVSRLAFAPSQLDTVPLSGLISEIGKIFTEVSPDIIYLPFRNDAHSDHRYVFDATMACTKWFRYPSIKRVLAYETISESDYGNPLNGNAFQPNVFVDISKHLDSKLEIIALYKSEIGMFPFPRSKEAVVAQAKLRGSACGCLAAEAFFLIKETV